MTKRWRRDPSSTGLARIGEGPRGSTLREEALVLASTSYSRGEWEYPVGWWWSCGTNKELGIERRNTCRDTFFTEKEAKDQAKAYITKCIKIHREKLVW